MSETLEVWLMYDSFSVFLRRKIQTDNFSPNLISNFPKLWVQTCIADLCWGILARLHQRNVTLHCWAHLRFMELLQGFACGKQMGASWSSSLLLSFSHTLSFANWLILSHQLTSSPNQTCHSATASTHTWSSKLVTQPSFCLLNAIFHQHCPRWTL